MKTIFGISILLTFGILFQAHTQNTGYFESISSTGRAVNGVSLGLIGTNYGGHFHTNGTTGRAVYGLAAGTTQENYGGYFQADGTTGRAVFGLAAGTTQENYGGYFQADGTTGRAVFGLAAGTTHENYGGWFKAKGIEGRGVYGEASDVNNINYGGYFLAKSIQGRAVFGLAEYEQNGTNYGGWFKGKGTSGGTGVYAWGKVFDFYADGPGTDYGSSSSKRWKSNIRNIDNPIEKLNNLRGVYYNWDEKHGGLHDVGFIAEEVGEILPEIVDYELNGVDAKGMDYSKLTPLLVEASNAMRREYQQKFDSQQKEINDLKIKFDLLEQLLNPKQ